MMIQLAPYPRKNRFRAGMLAVITSSTVYMDLRDKYLIGYEGK